MAAQPQQQNYEVPEDGNEEVCGGCSKIGRLICCDACPAAFHAPCVGYSSLEEVPDGEWLCWACSLAQGKSFLYPRTQLQCQEIGDKVMVAAQSRKPSVWAGKVANPGEVFHAATVQQMDAGSVQVLYEHPVGQPYERIPRSSERLWHGTTDLPLAWVQTHNHGWCPNARAFAIDVKRVRGRVPGAPQTSGSPVAQPSAASSQSAPATAAAPLAQGNAATTASAGSAPTAGRMPPLAAGSMLAVESSMAAGSAVPQRQPGPGSSAKPAAPAAKAAAALGAPAAGVAQHSCRPMARDAATGQEVEPADESTFMAALHKFHDQRGKPLRLPIRLIKDKVLDLYKLWCQVMSYGGYEPVTSASLWATMARALDAPASMTTASYVTRNTYSDVLLDFEQLTRKGETGIPVPVATRDLPKGGRPGRKPAVRRKAGLAAKPEPWMSPLPHVWMHIYLPAPERVAESLPAAKRRRVEPPPEGGNAGAAAPAELSAPEKRSHQKGASKAVREEKPPLDPGLTAEDLAGPVDLSEAAADLKEGDAVEVRSLAVGRRGYWTPATVLQIAQGSIAEGSRRFLIEYRDYCPSNVGQQWGASAAAAADGGAASGALAAQVDGRAAATQQSAQPNSAIRAQEWVPLLSRATMKAFPLVRLRLPRLPAPVGEPQSLSPGEEVEVWCGEGWAMGCLAGTPEALQVQEEAPPNGEGQTIDVADRRSLRKAHPAAAWGFGMVAPLDNDNMLPRDRYRRWLRPKTYRLEAQPFESYACAEMLPSARKASPPGPTAPEESPTTASGASAGAESGGVRAAPKACASSGGLQKAAPEAAAAAAGEAVGAAAAAPASAGGAEAAANTSRRSSTADLLAPLLLQSAVDPSHPASRWLGPNSLRRHQAAHEAWLQAVKSGAAGRKPRLAAGIGGSSAAAAPAAGAAASVRPRSSGQASGNAASGRTLSDSLSFAHMAAAPAAGRPRPVATMPAAPASANAAGPSWQGFIMRSQPAASVSQLPCASAPPRKEATAGGGAPSKMFVPPSQPLQLKYSAKRKRQFGSDTDSGLESEEEEAEEEWDSDFSSEEEPPADGSDFEDELRAERAAAAGRAAAAARAAEADDDEDIDIEGSDCEAEQVYKVKLVAMPRKRAPLPSSNSNGSGQPPPAAPLLY